MRVITCWFKRMLKDGKLQKIGTAVFYDGMKKCTRTLYVCKETDEYYVMFNGEAHLFVPRKCIECGCYTGRIPY